MKSAADPTSAELLRLDALVAQLREENNCLAADLERARAIVKLAVVLRNAIDKHPCHPHRDELMPEAVALCDAIDAATGARP